jgi:hypothetical protein
LLVMADVESGVQTALRCVASGESIGYDASLSDRTLRQREPAIMNQRTGHTVVFAILLFGSIAGVLPARAAVTRHYARETVRGEMVLVGVTVERGEAPETELRKWRLRKWDRHRTSMFRSQSHFR